MDAIQSIECLESNGVITPEQAQSMKTAAASLPTNLASISSLLLAASFAGITGGGSSSNPFAGLPISSESILLDDEATAESLTPPPGASRAIISVLGNNIIFRLDGIAPTITAGHFASQGSNFIVTQLSDFKAIPSSAVDANLFVSYY